MEFYLLSLLQKLLRVDLGVIDLEEVVQEQTDIIVQTVVIDPVNLGDIGTFLQSVLHAFQDPIFYAYVLMLSFAIALGIKRILIGGWGS